MDMTSIQTSSVLGGNRNVAVTQALSSRLLNASVGDRFDKLADLQDEFGVGAGTIQTAIKNIEKMDGVRFRRSGHQGTHIEDLNFKQLWIISGRAPLIGAFPSFSAKEMQVARVMLRKRFSKYGIPISTTQQSGAGMRIQSVLDNKVDFAVLSNGVIELTPSDLKERLSVFYFQPGSYYQPDSVVNLYRAGFDPYSDNSKCRTGIDPNSSDHYQLSMAEFDDLDQTDSVECNYLDIPKLILENKIDRAVWHLIDTLIPLDLIGIQYAPLRLAASKALLMKFSQMVLVTRTDDQFIGRLALEE